MWLREMGGAEGISVGGTEVFCQGLGLFGCMVTEVADVRFM